MQLSVKSLNCFPTFTSVGVFIIDTARFAETFETSFCIYTLVRTRFAQAFINIYKNTKNHDVANVLKQRRLKQYWVRVTMGNEAAMTNTEAPHLTSVLNPHDFYCIPQSLVSGCSHVTDGLGNEIISPQIDWLPRTLPSMLLPS